MGDEFGWTGYSLGRITELQQHITAISFAINQMKYHSSLLHERYQQELLNIFNDHKGIMTPINTELRKYRKECEQSVAQEYVGQIAAMEVKAKAIGDELKVKLMHDLLGIEKDLQNTKDYVKEVQAKVEKAAALVNSHEFDQQGFRERLAKMKTKWKEDLEKNIKQEKERCAKLIEQAKERMKTLDDTYQKSVIDLRKKFFAFSRESAQMKTMSKLRGQFECKLLELEELKRLVGEICLESTEKMARNRESINAVLNQMLEARLSHETTLADAEKDIEMKQQKMYEALKALETQKEERRNQLSEELDGMHANWEVEKEVLAREREKAERLASSDTILSQEELDEYREHLQTERKKMETLISKDEEIVANSCTEHETELTELKTSTEHEQMSYRKMLESKSKTHEMERMALMTELRGISDQARKDHEDEAGAIRVELEKRHMEATAYSQNLLVKQALESSIEQIKQSYNETIASFDDQAEWKKQLEKEVAELEIDQKKRIKELECEQKTSVLKRREDNKVAIEEKRQQLMQSYETTLKAIETEYLQDGVINGILGKYNEDYTKYRQELDAVSAPDSGEAGKIIDELEKATTQHKVRTSEIASEREEFSKKCEEERLKEIERHETLMSTFDTSKNEADLAQMKEDVTARKSELETLEKSLAAELEQLQRATFSIDTPDEDALLAALQDEVGSAKRDNTELPSKALESKKQEVLAKKTELDCATRQYFENLESEKSKLEEEINTKANLIVDRERALRDEIENSKRQQSRAIGESQIALQRRKNELKDLVTTLRSDLHTFKAKRVTEKQRRMELDHEKHLYVDRMRIFQRDSKTWMAVIQRQKEERVLELEELVKSARRRRDSAKSAFYGRSMRHEEAVTIKRLEEIAEQKLDELMPYAKDMMIFRSRLQTQEDVYNTRFGATPSVAVMGTTQVRRNTSLSQALPKKSLPRL